MDSHYISNIDSCRIVSLPRHEDPNGSLTEVQNTPGGDFMIKRVFYLYDVPADSERGGHSHRLAREIIVAVSGSFDVTVDDGHRRRTFTLDRPYTGLYIPTGVWRTLSNFSGSSVCLVLTTEKYDETDYVRSYDEFLELTHHKSYMKPGPKYPFLNLYDCNSSILGEIKEAVNRVIDSGRYIGGREVANLELSLSQLTGAPYAVGVSNGLDALRLIFRAYMEMGRLKEGDEVIVPANTYIASVLAVTDMGLMPVFVEPDINTLNIDTALIEKALTPRTKAILTVHLYGRTAWDETLAAVAKRRGLLVIEDNAQAIGARSFHPGLFGTYITGGLGHAGAFSFYPTKNVGAMGDAGAVVTHDKALADTVRALSNYGSDRRYHNIYTGYNCRLDPMQAAIIGVKISHLTEETSYRRRIAGIYLDNITNPAVRLPLADTEEQCVWHQFVVLVDDRDSFRKYLADNGVETDVHYATPPHKQPCYAQYADQLLPVTTHIADHAVSLPISRCTSAADALEIAHIINSYHTTETRTTSESAL